MSHEIDDFCKLFFPQFERGLLPANNARRHRALTMSASEIMTIVVLFHLSHYRDFKNFYLDCVLRQMRGCFPKVLSYNRFVEVQGRVFCALCAFMKAKTGHAGGLYYVDSTTIKVCRNQRINQHQTFDGIAQRGKSSPFGGALLACRAMNGLVLRLQAAYCDQRPRGIDGLLPDARQYQRPQAGA